MHTPKHAEQTRPAISSFPPVFWRIKNLHLSGVRMGEPRRRSPPPHRSRSSQRATETPPHPLHSSSRAPSSPAYVSSRRAYSPSLNRRVEALPSAACRCRGFSALLARPPMRSRPKMICLVLEVSSACRKQRPPPSPTFSNRMAQTPAFKRARRLTQNFQKESNRKLDFAVKGTSSVGSLPTFHEQHAATPTSCKQLERRYVRHVERRALR